MEMPTIRHLECLVAVADTLSFRRAAARCHISQPALSAQIKQLETLLGLSLFERDKRRVLTTKAGEVVAEKARLILADLRELSDVSRLFQAPLSGVFRMGVIPTIAPYFLPRAVNAIHDAFPQAQLTLREDQTHRLLASLERGDLDVLLLALEVELGGMKTMAIMEDPFWLTVPCGHRLAGRKRVRLKDLNGEQILLLEDGHCLRDQALEICRLAEASELHDFRASSPTTLVQMVAGGMGVTLVPEIALEYECSPERQLSAVPFGGEKPKRTIGLVYRPSSLRHHEFEVLAELLREKVRLNGD